jgi:hypothetical protein
LRLVASENCFKRIWRTHIDYSQAVQCSLGKGKLCEGDECHIEEIKATNEEMNATLRR